MPYERLTEPLAPTHRFIMRMAGNLVVVLILIALSLTAGMWGYHDLEGMSWIDAFANASMILSGMGPLGELHTDQGKLFAGAYAIYSGLFLIIAAGLLLSPVAHRLLHRLHLDDDRAAPARSGKR